MLLQALTPAQVEELISLLDSLAEARREKMSEYTVLSREDVLAPQRKQLTDYAYSLTNEQRSELIVLMLVGCEDLKVSHDVASQVRSKYNDDDAQVSYLMSKTFRLAEYLRAGLERVLEEPSMEANDVSSVTSANLDPERDE